MSLRSTGARRALTALAAVALAGAWLYAVTRLWVTTVPDDLALPHLDPHRFFSSAELDRASDFETFLAIDALLAAIAQLVALGLYARHGARFMRESAAGPIGTGMLLGMLGLGIVWIVQFPFALAGQWWERRHGISHQGYLSWTLDHWLAVAGPFLFISLALLIVMWVGSLLRERWWLVGGPALVAVGLAFAFVQPYLIPDLHPLKDPRIAADARRLADAEGVPGAEVRVQNTHNLTSAANAEAVGFGPSKRVIVWDTLLTKFNRPEVDVVLGHELGHLSRGHIWKKFAWTALLALPIGLAVMLVTRRRGGIWKPEAVPLALFALVLVGFVLSPLQNAFSRRLESEADWIALQTTHDPHAAIGLFRGFTRISLANPTPPGWENQLFGDHPSIIRRIEMAEAWKAREAGG